MDKKIKKLLKATPVLRDGRSIAQVVVNEIRRALHHLTPRAASKSPVTNHFARMLFDEVKGKGSYAELHIPRPDKSRPSKNGPPDMLSKFRFYARQGNYNGPLGPLTIGEAKQGDAYVIASRLVETARSLADSQFFFRSPLATTVES